MCAVWWQRRGPIFPGILRPFLCPAFRLPLAGVICRDRFREARVLVFGSSAGQLASPESDIDITLHLPSRLKLIQELKVTTTSAVSFGPAPL